ncbi:helix-turn-helix transcriptional regulator [Longispora sp. NPDC051575]|uniref:helix-turn-helix domain-containing protein n=1 Tax=Longispora sp. NPDC051575 TaxID=3154943 RepID=UPI00344A901A
MIMAKAAIERGPTAQRVSHAIHSLRTDAGLSLAGLGERLAGVGRPIGEAVLSKVELGGRRVDVDDLVAFAAALGVSPNRLLLPPEGSDEPVDLTSTVTVSSRTAWQWASGERPLTESPPLEDVDRFQLACRPHDPPRVGLAHVAVHDAILGPVAAALAAALDAGLALTDVIAYAGAIGAAHERYRLANESDSATHARPPGS